MGKIWIKRGLRWRREGVILKHKSFLDGGNLGRQKTVLLLDESGIMGTFWAEGFWAGEARP